MDRLGALLDQKHRAVMAEFGTNSVPEALEILDPIRKQLRKAEEHRDHLLGEDAPRVSDPSSLLNRLGIKTSQAGLPDLDDVHRYISSRIEDRTLSPVQATRLRFILAQRTRRITNPASKGAQAYAETVAQVFAMFGIERAKQR